MTIPLTPSTRLSHHRESYVEISCGTCGHTRQVTADALARLIGWEASLFYLTGKFRCSHCGARRAQISFGYDRKPRWWVKNPS